ncbi:MAG: right-handed parallel beta-helix repeat-containing protein, partial [Rubrobacteraceae bacterium]|nr:right-handed parallel beta-helix repeat-containing protein [Rubrobacteraceae bacterium]
MFAQTKNLSLLGFALLLACIFSLAYASQSGAATLTTVTSNADSGTGTLREAVATADSNGEPDTITFDLLEGQRTITLTSGQISFTEAQETTVDGGGVVTVSGNDSSRVFDVGADASLTVRGLTVRDGSALVGGDDFDLSGGGIRSSGTLTIVGSNLTGNSADWDGGGIFNRGGVLSVVGTTVSDNTAPEGYGGGIWMSNGTMTIDRSTVSGNTASDTGGGIVSRTDLEAERTTITNSTISGNTASDDEEGGSGIFNVDGLTVIEHSTITGNTAPDGVGSG